MSTSNSDPPPQTRRKKRKRRSKKARAVSEFDANGRKRPGFVLGFPNDPDLNELVRAYEAGDFATVRAEAPALAERSDDPQVQDAAWELRNRIEPDPLARYLLVISCLMLLFLIFWTYTGHFH